MEHRVNDSLETELLAELIGQKQQVLEQLRELARRQTDLVGEGDMTKLLSVLAAKQSRLNELQAVERRLDPFRHQEPDSRQWPSPDDRQRARQAAERCEALLSEIVLLEKHSQSDLIRRRDEAAARLQGTHSAAVARSAYVASPPLASGQLDLSSEA
jgi:hypothetical protein